MGRAWGTTMLMISIGAILGANTRFMLGYWLARVWPTTFPVATGLINISGSLLLGLCARMLQEHPSTHSSALLMVGFLGSYTTFSTFSVETLTLWQTQRYVAALFYACASPLLGVLAAAAGMWLANKLLY